MVRFSKILPVFLAVILATSLASGVETSASSRATVSSSLPLRISLDMQSFGDHTSTSNVSVSEPANPVSLSKTAQGMAFWQSFLVPGLGQIATGRPEVGYAFLTAEAALIGGLVGLRIYAGRLESNYRSFAGQHAGVPTDQEHQYYVDLGNWLDVRAYNEARLRDRSYDALYNDPGDAWHWDTDNNRLRFKEMRIDSDEARGRALLLVGGLVLNHLFSAVEAARGAAKKVEVGYSVLPEGGGRITLGYRLTR